MSKEPKPCTMWQAEDGSFHLTKEKACTKNDLIELETWYNANKLYGNYVGCCIEWEDFFEWCRENKAKIVQVSKVC